VAYLQELHSLGVANSDHTTLLLNTYTKLKDAAWLDSFIKTKSKNGAALLVVSTNFLSILIRQSAFAAKLGSVESPRSFGHTMPQSSIPGVDAASPLDNAGRCSRTTG
jgi:hypothetical protein